MKKEILYSGGAVLIFTGIWMLQMNLKIGIVPIMFGVMLLLCGVIMNIPFQSKKKVKK